MYKLTLSCKASTCKSHLMYPKDKENSPRQFLSICVSCVYRGRCSHSNRARIKVLYFLLLTRLWDFCAILSNVRQTSSTNPALVNNSVCLRAHIYRPWLNYMTKQLLTCSLLLSYVKHECHFINRVTLFFICTEDLADLPIFIVELLNILFSGLP